MTTLTLTQLYRRLAQAGPSGWWPADSPYEILVGAILVQNTNWQNVDRSLTNLRTATGFDPRRLAAMPADELQPLIRPSGFYRHKSVALASLFAWLAAQDFALEKLAADPNLRQALLALPGIGEETADAMRLYVFNQPTFIADHYARRLFGWLGQPTKTYAQLLARTTEVSTWSPHDAQELHGLIDNLGKRVKSATDLQATSLAGTRLTLPPNENAHHSAE